MTGRIDDATGLTRAERCLEYQLTLVRYEAAADALSDGLPPERRERIDKLRGVTAGVCDEVEEDMPRDDTGMPD